MAGINPNTLVFSSKEDEDRVLNNITVVEEQPVETDDTTIPTLSQEQLNSGVAIFPSEEESETTPPIYDEPIGETTIDDAFDALITRQTDLPADERKRALSRELFDAEETMIDPRLSLTNRQAQLLLPPTEKMAKREDIPLTEVLTDIRKNE